MTFNELVELLKNICGSYLEQMNFDLIDRGRGPFMPDAESTDYFTISAHYRNENEMKKYARNKEIDRLVAIERERITKEFEEKYRAKYE